MLCCIVYYHYAYINMELGIIAANNVILFHCTTLCPLRWHLMPILVVCIFIWYNVFHGFMSTIIIITYIIIIQFNCTMDVPCTVGQIIPCSMHLQSGDRELSKWQSDINFWIWLLECVLERFVKITVLCLILGLGTINLRKTVTSVQIGGSLKVCATTSSL